MAIVSTTTLRDRLAEILDRLSHDHEHVARQGARSVLIVGEEEYESLLETLHPLRSPANAQDPFGLQRRLAARLRPGGLAIH